MAEAKRKRGVVETVARFSNGLMQKFMPDAYVFAAVLTFLVFIFAFIATRQSYTRLIAHWGAGVWSLLSFTMQMVLVLVTGHVLALAPAFKRLLDKLSDIPKTPAQGIALVTIISYIACILNWGFGLVIGAIYAKEIAKKLRGIDYRLLIASAYTGFILWHAGLSGSIPLTLAGGDVSATAGAVSGAIPTSRTLFAPYNIFIVLATLVALPLINVLMHPKSKEDVISIDPSLLQDDSEPAKKPTKEERARMTPAERMENSIAINIVLAILGFSYIIYYFVTSESVDLNLNIVNFVFLMLGILLHKTPKSLIGAYAEAIKGAAGIVLQFPLYAGIMGVMTGASETGVSLGSVISDFFVSISNEHTFPLFTWLSAGLVNIFVPSGGGQWAVQGPVMMPAGNVLGVDPAKTAMAIAYGDAWTNMIQPFWALPALGIAKLGARDVLGYTSISMLAIGIVIAIGLLVF